MFEAKDYDSNEEDATLPIGEEIIYPGLVLKNDYVLLKMIGYGNNAKVWMTYRFTSKAYFAMKIQDYKCYNDGCREVAIINEITKFCAKNPERHTYCIKLIDFFEYQEDEDTKYVCSVYELYAGSIKMIIDQGKYKYGLPIPVVKEMTRQLLKAMVILHDELGIIHTDIKPQNILFKGTMQYHLKIIDCFVQSDFETKYQNLCSVYKVGSAKFNEELEILAFDCVRDICYLQTEFMGNEEFIPDNESEEIDSELIEGEADDSDSSAEERPEKFNDRDQSVDDIVEHLDYQEIHSLEEFYDFTKVLNNRANTTDNRTVVDDKYVINCQTALTDFGNAYFYKKRTRNEIQDRLYRAPEIILDLNYGYMCDIWSVCCVVFELLTGYPLFEPEDALLNRDLHHLFLMEKMFGSMPLDMKKKSKRRKFLFDKQRDYHIKNVEEINPVSIKERLMVQFLYSEKDAEEIQEFLLGGFQYYPHLRMRAKELLNHPWLNIENKQTDPIQLN